MKKEYLKIIIPEKFTEIPIKIIRSHWSQKIIFDMETSEYEKYSDPSEHKYAMVWNNNEYQKISFDEIRWITAEGSYSLIHLTGGRELIVSFHLSVIGGNLPPADFLRIHRSHIVNLSKVDSLIGNILKIGEVSLPIGREYRQKVFDRFIFLGIRRNRKKNGNSR